MTHPLTHSLAVDSPMYAAPTPSSSPTPHASDAGHLHDLTGAGPRPGASRPEDLRQRYAEVKQRVAAAAKKAGLSAEQIMLVAVSKYSGVDEIRELISLGHTDFGENQVQQLIQRVAAVNEWVARQKGLGASSKSPAASKIVAPRWHMIGHLQRNKSRKAVELCRLVHSVDSLRLAEELQAAALKQDTVIDALIQVNASGEKSKYGCAIAAAPYLAEQMMTMANVRVRGLMTMAPYDANPEQARPTFARTRELFDEMAKSGVAGAPGHHGAFNILSMGMSGDYEVAISEGANLVRVGSAIFGEARLGPGNDREHEHE